VEKKPSGGVVNLDLCGTGHKNWSGDDDGAVNNYPVNKYSVTLVLTTSDMVLCWLRRQTICHPSVRLSAGSLRSGTSGGSVSLCTVRRGICSASAITTSMLRGREMLPSVDTSMFLWSTLWRWLTLLRCRACCWCLLYHPLRIIVSEFLWFTICGNFYPTIQ